MSSRSSRVQKRERNFAGKRLPVSSEKLFHFEAEHRRR
jgi:hypothetical protein